MQATERNQTRRTEGVRVSGRAARVVEDVLRATAEELSRVGYAALRVEDVAVRSGVNKTTIYRRWPKKSELVVAALHSVMQRPSDPDTGSLRADFLESLGKTVTFCSSPAGRGLVRVLQTERTHPEVEPIAKALRDEFRRARAAMVVRAIERGELPRGTNPEIVAELIAAPVYSRLIIYDEVMDTDFVATVIDVVLAGARAGAALTDDG